MRGTALNPEAGESGAVVCALFAEHHRREVIRAVETAQGQIAAGIEVHLGDCRVVVEIVKLAVGYLAKERFDERVDKCAVGDNCHGGQLADFGFAVGAAAQFARHPDYKNLIKDRHPICLLISS